MVELLFKSPVVYVYVTLQEYLRNFLESCSLSLAL